MPRTGVPKPCSGWADVHTASTGIPSSVHQASIEADYGSGIEDAMRAITVFLPRFPLIPAVLASVVAGDLLMWGATPGVGLGLAFLGAGGVLTWRFPQVLAGMPGCAALSVLVVAVLAQIGTAGLLPSLLAVGALAVLAMVGRTGRGWDGVALLELWSVRMFELPWLAFRDLRFISRWRVSHGRKTWRILLWALPCLFGALFAGLFSLANPVLGTWLSQAWEWLIDHVVVPDIGRLALWWATGLLLWGLLRRRWRLRENTVRSAPAFTDHIGLVRRSLVVFHVLFALQNFSDACYLWGGTALPASMSYADYAHRGAYPLIATALLAAGFILAWFRPGSPVQQDRWCRMLVLGWLAQNLVLLISALWRLHLYVDVYSLTRWRVAAAVWMVLVGIGLALIAWRIHRHFTNRWLVNANLTSLLVVLLVIALCDIDGYIARENVAHRQEICDIDYLASLGPAALPALRPLAMSDPNAAYAVAQLEAELANDLSDWRSWTVRRAQWRDEQRQRQ